MNCPLCARGLEPLGVGLRRTQSHKSLTKRYVARTKNWGSGFPFSKNIVISIRLTCKNVKSIVGFKGVEPLGVGWGGTPKNFAYVLAWVGAMLQKNFVSARMAQAIAADEPAYERSE